MEFLRKLKDNVPFQGLVTLIGGILLIAFPGYTGKGLCYLLSAVLILRGAGQLIESRSTAYNPAPFPLNSLWNALLIGLGLFVAVQSDIILSIIPFFFGIYFISSSISSLRKSSVLRKSGYKNWGIETVFAIGKTILAILFLYNPFPTAMALIRFTGCCLVYDGATGMVEKYRAARQLRQAEKARGKVRDLNLKKYNGEKSNIPKVDAEIVGVEEEIKDSDLDL